MKVFIDTNIYLSFFHFAKDDLTKLEDLVKLIDKNIIELILPEQVVFEFRRNRENKISESLSQFTKKISLSLPQIIKSYKDKYDKCIILQKSLNKILTELENDAKVDIEQRTLKADLLIESLFEKAKKIDISDTVLKKVVLRSRIGNPPGKKGSNGDAIIWEMLLAEKGIKELFFISDDKDYKSDLNNHKMKRFLREEWFERKGKDLKYYDTLTGFLDENHPDLNLSTEKQKDIEIDRLADSSSFSETHMLIARLKKYQEFTPPQLTTLAEIYLTNRQVHWIILDEDVLSFAEDIILRNEDVIDDDLVIQLQALISSSREAL